MLTKIPRLARARPSLRAAWKAASILERRRFIAELMVDLLPPLLLGASPTPVLTTKAGSSSIGDATLDEFLSRCVVKSPGGRVQSSMLYESYRQLCLANDREPISQKAFSTRLSERGYAKRQSSVIWWVGIQLIADGVQC